MCFKFSHIHSWQGDESVTQILVFPDSKSEILFKEEYLERIQKYGLQHASDSRIGAMYKLRSVKDSDNKYIPMIRAGTHAGVIWQGSPQETVDAALFMTMEQMYRSIFVVDSHNLDKGNETFTYLYIRSFAQKHFNELKRTS